MKSSSSIYIGLLSSLRQRIAQLETIFSVFLWSYYLHGMYLQLVSGIVMLQTDGSNNFCGGF